MGGCGCVCHGESLGGCTRKMGAARTPSDNPERAVRVRERMDKQGLWSLVLLVRCEL